MRRLHLGNRKTSSVIPKVEKQMAAETCSRSLSLSPLFYLSLSLSRLKATVQNESRYEMRRDSRRFFVSGQRQCRVDERFLRYRGKGTRLAVRKDERKTANRAVVAMMTRRSKEMSAENENANDARTESLLSISWW